MTLELSPDVEERLRTNAAVHGLPVTEYLVTLAANDPVIDLSEFRDMADLEAGRTMSLEELSVELAARRKAREAN